MNQDLTVGKPSRVLIRFCLPLLGSMFFQQLYNLADSLIVGKYVGEDALAAVGNSYEITLVFIAFAFGVNVGCSVIAGQLFGARNYGAVRTTVYTTLLSGAILCALLMGLGFLFGAELLHRINTPQAVFADSLLYLNIYVLGLPFLFFYNISNGVFSALGDSRTPFYFLAASSTANVAADYVFVTVFHMGVAGVAWATFLCQGISCVFSVAVVLRRLMKLPASEGTALFSWHILDRIARVAIPTIFQQCFISVGNVLVQGVINSFGTAVMAGYSAAIKLNNLVISCLVTAGNGISNFTAQNLGAGKLGRIRTGMRQGLKLAWLLCVPVALGYFLGGRALMSVFLEDGQGQAVAEGMTFLRTVAPFYFLIAIKLISDGILRGSGMMGPFMVGTFTDMFLRVLLVFVLSAPFGSLGIWLAWPGSWCVGTVISVYYYRRGIWRDTQPE